MNVAVGRQLLRRSRNGAAEQRRRARARPVRRRFACLLLVVGLLALTASVGVAPAAAQTDIEQLLPPGTRNVVAAVRVLKSLGARNRVYREAGQLQPHLRAYYDQRIETAQQQMVRRQQAGLRESQFRAYARVKARLEAEREAAIGITEDEKSAAKLSFESRLRRQVVPALAETPRARRAVRRLKDTGADLRAALQRAQDASDLRAALDDVRRRVQRLEEIAELGALLPGAPGQHLRRLAAEARRVVDEAGSGLDEATAAAETAVARLDAALADLDAQTERRPITDLDVEGLIEDLVARIFLPGDDTPTADLIAEAIARGYDPALLRALGVATGLLDPADLATMRDRVRGALLRETLERIARRCGRLTGALQRAAVDAAVAESALPDGHPPCALFGNHDRLAALLEASRQETAEDEGDEAAEPGVLADGAYEATIEPSAGQLQAIHHNNVLMLVEGDSFHLTVFLELTWGGPACSYTMRTTYEGSGEVNRDGRRIDFRGTLEDGQVAKTGECSGFPGVETWEDWPVTVWLEEHRFLESNDLGGTFRLVPVGG